VDEFLAAQRETGRPGVAGWWDRVLPELTDDQRASLEEAARHRDISHSTIAVVLGRWGFQVTQQQVGHWRRHHVR
jgi:hypothetical protein